ncbi:heterokaryon incompatibility protein-domain-containing protein [Rhypophila decipiens]|uniref:Heterokaryon incompatibility protein-domain-containing protein n=1 Tax=Rhypophila decipiens TaxID=261697 RepID=A0AAN6XU73_9PEZI|nr:heterokaryon incompatibility protein-domain-containing protein [Rhypophila decipiens]
MPPTTRSRAATATNSRAKKPATDPPPAPAPTTTHSTRASTAKRLLPPSRNRPPKPPTKKTAAKKTAIVDYEYGDLNTPDEIRLLTVLPGEFHDDIVLRISHERLVLPEPQPPLMSMSQLQETVPPGWEVDQTRDGRFLFLGPDEKSDSWKHPDPDFDSSRYIPQIHNDGPKYEALSYTWEDWPDGGNNTPELVHIQTCVTSTRRHSCNMSCLTRLSATSNLATALRHLRADHRRTLPLWIDAISINQASISERNTQVRRMTDIFHLAHRVIVWLGPSTHDSRKALDTLSHLGQHFMNSRNYHCLRSHDAPGQLHWDQMTRLPYDDSTWAAVDNLLTRPWFKRVWVVQEIQLASDALVYCGGDTIPSNWLWQANYFIWWNNHRPLPGSIFDMVADFGVRTAGVRASMDTMRQTSQRECTDPRDLVYGMMGIYPAGLRALIVPDYGKQVWEVYRDLVLGHLSFVQRLEIFRWFGSQRNREDQSGWPSWVPDIHKPPAFHTRMFAAGYSRSEPTGCDSGDLCLLPAKGVQCATVTSIIDLSVRAHSGFPAIAEAVRDQVLRDDQNTVYYVTGESYLDVYAKTMSVGRLIERLPGVLCPSLETWTRRLSPLGLCAPRIGYQSPEQSALTDSDWERFERQRLNEIKAIPAFFETEEGYVGLGPTATRPGDLIAVLLGCVAPMVLRLQAQTNTYTVVGQAYCHGLHDGTALLGPLPHPWNVQVFRDCAGRETIFRFHNPETGEVSDEDPRLDPLPEGWERITRDRTENDPEVFQCFRNKSTDSEETITYDPRMSPEALRARGVDIRTFSLV